MRVKFDDHIDLCKRVRHTKGESVLLITTIYDAIYTVDCTSNTIATNLYNQLCDYGYIDVSDLSYSNL